jgi:hypothetical protein
MAILQTDPSSFEGLELIGKLHRLSRQSLEANGIRRIEDLDVPSLDCFRRSPSCPCARSRSSPCQCNDRGQPCAYLNPANEDVVVSQLVSKAVGNVSRRLVKDG